MINKVTLIGNLGGDPEVRHLESGVIVARFSLATNESYKDKDGNWQTMTEWHNVVVWRDLAERAEKQLKKGMTVYVEGKISYRKYTHEGVERYATDIVANTYRLLERKEGSGENRFPSTEPAAMRTNGGNGTAVMPTADVTATAEGGGDDLPF